LLDTGALGSTGRCSVRISMSSVVCAKAIAAGLEG
jgi:hypothetical protein